MNHEICTCVRNTRIQLKFALFSWFCIFSAHTYKPCVNCISQWTYHSILVCMRCSHFMQFIFNNDFIVKYFLIALNERKKPFLHFHIYSDFQHSFFSHIAILFPKSIGKKTEKMLFRLNMWVCVCVCIVWTKYFFWYDSTLEKKNQTHKKMTMIMMMMLRYVSFMWYFKHFQKINHCFLTFICWIQRKIHKKPQL